MMRAAGVVWLGLALLCGYCVAGLTAPDVEAARAENFCNAACEGRVVKEVLHVAAVSLVAVAPSLARPVWLEEKGRLATREGSEVIATDAGWAASVALEAEVLVEEKPVGVVASAQEAAITVPLQYETLQFNVTVGLFRDPYPVIRRFCELLAIDDVRCAYVHAYVRDRIHTEAARRGAVAGTAEDDAHHVRHLVLAGFEACVYMWKLGVGMTSEAPDGPDGMSPSATVSCAPLLQLGNLRMWVWEQGAYQYELQLRPTHDTVFSELTRFESGGGVFRAQQPCTPALAVVAPLSGATVRLHPHDGRRLLRLRVRATTIDTPPPRLCITAWLVATQAVVVDHLCDTVQWQRGDGQLLVSMPSGVRGRVHVRVTAGDAAPAGLCPLELTIEVVATPVPHLLPPDTPPTHTASASTAPLVVVTAASQSYFDERRLHNMVGSLHTWTSENVAIVVYDLGLDAESVRDLEQWDRVTLRPLPTQGLPPHVSDIRGTYAFKAVILEDALRMFHRVVWMDANVEVRRPLDELGAIMDANGHFATIQRLAFPNPLRHHPATTARLGCTAPEASRRQCWSGVLGVVRDSWFHRHVVRAMLACSLDKGCIAPAGSTRDNHRHDQSAMNAIMCSLGVSVCIESRQWWAGHLDAADDGAVLHPTRSALQWNAVRVYNRREHSYKPFESLVQRSP